MVDPNPSCSVRKQEWGVVLLLLREEFLPVPAEVPFVKHFRQRSGLLAG